MEAVEAILYPGDVLFLPAFWFHRVEALDVSISVNVRSLLLRLQSPTLLLVLFLPACDLPWLPAQV